MGTAPAWNSPAPFPPPYLPLMAWPSLLDSTTSHGPPFLPISGLTPGLASQVCSAQLLAHTVGVPRTFGPAQLSAILAISSPHCHPHPLTLTLPSWASPTFLQAWTLPLPSLTHDPTATILLHPCPRAPHPITHRIGGSEECTKAPCNAPAFTSPALPSFGHRAAPLLHALVHTFQPSFQDMAQTEALPGSFP